MAEARPQFFPLFGELDRNEPIRGPSAIGAGESGDASMTDQQIPALGLLGALGILRRRRP